MIIDHMYDNVTFEFLYFHYYKDIGHILIGQKCYHVYIYHNTKGVLIITGMGGYIY